MFRLVVGIGLLGIAAFACDSDGGERPFSRSPDAHTFLLDWTRRELAQVDPATLDQVSGKAPIPMGHWASNYISPDGRLLASIIGETQNPEAKLHLFDVVDWHEEFVFEEPQGRLYFAAWAPDSRQLYVVSEPPDRSGERSLWAIGAESPEARKLADFAYWTDRVDISPDGRSIYLFAYDLADEETYTVDGDPFLVALDAETGEESARVDLPGMFMGQRKEQGGPDGAHYATYYPGRAMAPDGRRYYVAHAEDDEITVVDLEAMAVEKTAVPKRAESIFESIVDLLFGGGIAEAKGGAASSKLVIVSPDGKRLVVTGGHSPEPALNGPGFQPLGLRVLEADSLDILSEQEGMATAALSADGRWVLATGWSNEWTETGPNELSPSNYEGRGLNVIDAQTGEVVRVFEPGRIFESVIPSADGRWAYLVTQSPAYPGLAWKQEGCEAPCQTVTVYDIAAGLAVGERVFPTHAVELLTTIASGR